MKKKWKNVCRYDKKNISLPAELTSGGYIGGRREKTGKGRLIKREKGGREERKGEMGAEKS